MSSAANITYYNLVATLGSTPAVTREDDDLAADLIWKEVYRLTQPGQPPLVGSVAGGRKTMSIWLQFSFEHLARRTDQLVHVLVPPSLEKTGFYYPADPLDNAGLSRVTINFARQRRQVERSLLQSLADPSDRRAVIEAIARQEYERPAKIRVLLGLASGLPRSASLVEFLDATGEDIDTCQLSPNEVTTLLVLAEQIARGGGSVSLGALLSKEVHQQRALISTCCNADPDEPWERQEDTDEERLQKARGRASRAVSNLKLTVADVPVATEYLCVDGKTTGGDRFYRWRAKAMPPIEVVMDEVSFKYFERHGGEALFLHLPVKLLKSDEEEHALQDRTA